jgi:hypothetical protein
VSIAVDKHSGCGLPLTNCVLVTPNNVGVMLPPQVTLLGVWEALSDETSSHTRGGRISAELLGMPHVLSPP